MLPIPSNGIIDFSARRVLIVDDFDGMRNILRDLMRKCGAVNIDVATNGNDAINSLSRAKYDIVLCDYHLGPGKNGQQVLEEARANSLIGPATVWCIVTAEKTSDMVIGAAEHQPDDYLIKPLTEATLQARLSRLVPRKQALAKIQSAIQAKEYLKAISLCDRQLAEDKGGAMEVVRLRCELLILTGKYDDARAAYQALLARRETAWAKTGLAKLHFREGQYDEAKSLLQQVMQDNRSYLEAYDWLAKTLSKQGLWQEAQSVLQRATAISPNSVARQQFLGEAALQCADLDLAEQCFRKSLNLGTNSALKTAQPYLGLAKVHTQKGNPQEALEVLGKLGKEVEGEAAQLQAKVAEVRVFQACGDNDKAKRCAAELAGRIQAGASELPPAATLDLADALMEMGDKDSGSQLLQFVARNNHDDDALLNRAKGIFDRADMGEAGAEALESSRRQAIEAMDKGVRLATQGMYDESLEVMREACALMPNNGRVLLNHAYLLISHMDKKGVQPALLAEARKCIEIARKHGFDEKRCGQLLGKLETLKQA